MSRYSDIKRGQRLNQALTAYTTYLTTPRTPNLNTRGARPAQTTLYVEPYGFDIASDQIVAVRNPTEGYNQLNTLINGAGLQSLVANALGGKTAISRTGFTPARLITFQNNTRSVSVSTSNVTGQRYLKYSGNRYACAFGKRVAGDDLIDAINALRSAAKARTGFEVNRVSVTPERIKFR